MTEWAYNRSTFEPDEEWPDGTRPYEAMLLFAPWVDLATSLMDGDGAWSSLPWPGAMMEQPEIDMTILSIIRGRWNELRTEEMRRGAGRKR